MCTWIAGASGVRRNSLYGIWRPVASVNTPLGTAWYRLPLANMLPPLERQHSLNDLGRVAECLPSNATELEVRESLLADEAYELKHAEDDTGVFQFVVSQ